MARRGWRWCKICGRQRAGSPPTGRPAGTRQGRPMPAWTAGRWGTGLPQARRLLRPLVTGGGGRRTGSLQNGRPAGHCQGCPSLPGFPLGPNTFWMLRGGATGPAGRSRGLQPERRSERRAAGVRYRAGGGDGEVVLRSRAQWRVRWAVVGPLVGSMWCLPPKVKLWSRLSRPSEEQPCHTNFQKVHSSPYAFRALHGDSEATTTEPMLKGT